MDIKDFAKMIDGKEYDYDMFSEKELDIAAENGFVIVYGASDDLMEFDGAIYDEAGCYDGGRVYFNRDGETGHKEEGDSCIEALWCDKGAKSELGKIIPWTYKTDIPHETFMIYEDGEPYCRGIVFNITDVNQ